MYIHFHHQQSYAEAIQMKNSYKHIWRGFIFLSYPMKHILKLCFKY